MGRVPSLQSIICRLVGLRRQPAQMKGDLRLNQRRLCGPLLLCENVRLDAEPLAASFAAFAGPPDLLTRYAGRSSPHRAWSRAASIRCRYGPFVALCLPLTLRRTVST